MSSVRGFGPDDGALAPPVGRTLTVAGARTCVIVPAFQAARSIRSVLDELKETLECDPRAVIVVDDGSTDGTADRAREAGVTVVVSSQNRGKGAALVRGLEEAHALGFRVALTVDADGQHPAASAAELLKASDDPRALVLGIRDLARDGAPRKNRFSNGISNFFLSLFTGTPLQDTQCGLRRYPVEETLALQAHASGYAFEAEIILRAIAKKLPVTEHGVHVYYPPETERVTHFDSVKDPMRIIVTVVHTLYDLRRIR
jgi:glycosyltransferase involved in cell wall biosynthesis